MITFNSISKAWDKFFFDPAPVHGMAIFRILWGLILLLNFYFYIGNVEDFYGPNAILSLPTVETQFHRFHLNIFQFMSQKSESVYLVLAVYFLSIIGIITGRFTRTSLVVGLICLTSLHHRNIWLLSSAEFLLRLITLYLVFSPCGHALSLDSYFNKKRNSNRTQELWAPWVQRLLQIQLSVVYIWTAWHKLKGDAWFDGSAVYYATRLQDFYNFSTPFILDSVLLLKFMTWGTLVLEFSLGTLIWFKNLRKPLILLGIIFHIGIEYTMSIPYFEFIMMALLIVYFTPQEMYQFVQNMREKFAKINESIKIKPALEDHLKN